MRRTPDPILDEDGYPTETTLAAIRDWTGTPQQLVALLGEVFAAYGNIEITEITDDLRGAVYQVALVTGGWSGCEDAVCALNNSFFWVAYWHTSARGGLHTFTVPTNDWVTPVPDWPVSRPNPDADLATIAALREDLAQPDARDFVARRLHHGSDGDRAASPSSQVGADLDGQAAMALEAVDALLDTFARQQPSTGQER